ncbi:pecanex-like protein 1 [Lepeophtheirus salmonis]|uniref:pecanex-like protein 1 n=1 Tax=Lepeophtheirus salmonis TaxID=72036 RepID=UPI001AEB519C|nr:pecanex-like protein 1 [Lepeophtheirus salmonis]
MGSQTLDILRQGVWASLSGGWFYDPSKPLLANTLQLYLWLLLLLLPFSTYLWAGPSYHGLGWSSYSALLLILFSSIKYLNGRLHSMFDSSSPVTQVMNQDAQPTQDPGIEMTDMGPPKDPNPASPSIVESWTWGERNNKAPQEEPNSTFDLKVDVHIPDINDEDDDDMKSSSLRRRRYSNLSNLARSLPSYDSGANVSSEKRASVLRTHSALETGAFVHNREQNGGIKRSQSTHDEESSRNEHHRDDDEDSDVISQSPLLSANSIQLKLSSSHNSRKRDFDESGSHSKSLVERSARIQSSEKSMSEDLNLSSTSHSIENTINEESDNPDQASKTKSAIDQGAIPKKRWHVEEKTDLTHDPDTGYEIDRKCFRKKAFRRKRTQPSSLSSSPNASQIFEELEKEMKLENRRKKLRYKLESEDDQSDSIRSQGSGHFAKDHEDTTEGAIHCFIDEDGNLCSYSFGSESGGTAQAVPQSSLLSKRRESGGDGTHCSNSQNQWKIMSMSSSSASLNSNMTVVLDNSNLTFPTSRTSTSISNSNNNSGTGGAASLDVATTTASSSFRTRTSTSYLSNNRRSSGFSGSNTQLPLANSSISTVGFRSNRSPLPHFADVLIERALQAASRGLAPNTIADDILEDLNADLRAAAANPPGSSMSTQVIPTSASSGSVTTKLVINDVNDNPGDIFGPKVHKYYLFSFIGLKFKVFFDRLSLIGVFDRNITICENLISVIMAVLVGIFTALVLEQGLYVDIWIFLFCLVAAGCQYSLLKSVQPDSASPTHGFNRITVFGRPTYFIISCILILLLQAFIDVCTDGEDTCTIKQLELYGIIAPTHTQIVFIRNLILIWVLCFPIIFLLGLLPQIDTFVMYLLEQIDGHIFGGNAVSGLPSGFYCVFRSLLSVAILFGFAFGGLTGGKTHSKHTQDILFSIFCSLIVIISYHLSRSSSDPTVLLGLIKRQLLMNDIYAETSGGTPTKADPTPTNEDAEEEESDKSEVSSAATMAVDPLPKKLADTVTSRLLSDAIICTFIAIVILLLHVSGLFKTLQPNFSYVLWGFAIVVGVMSHYLLPQLRKQLPWLCFAHPGLKSYEYRHFEVSEPARVMWFEKLYVWLKLIERNVIYPLIFISALTTDIEIIKKIMPSHWGALVLVVMGLKALRASNSDPSRQYLILLLTLLFFQYVPPGEDQALSFIHPSRPFIISHFFMGIIFSKLFEFYLKVQFVITYIAPWQITWGSAFHAFAQPFSVPHSAMLFLQAGISSILSTPLNPILGSAIFITSYVRPVKFWERNYNTKRVDHSNTRLSSYLERNPGLDDNNLNSIFYEHLTRSMQECLCGDLALGRWGIVNQGDCFVLASDYLNCLVHIIELGNGLVTFQVRGLEFRGTYCQQREVAAISEGVEEDLGCCCCEPGHWPHMLSVNAAFSQRWLAWEVSSIKYILEGYSISDNSAISILQVFDLRKVLISYYVKSIIYYTLRSPKLEEWLENETISEALASKSDKNFVDLDPLFNVNIDEDYDFRASGITRISFCYVYYEWIAYCAQLRDPPIVNHGKDSKLVSLCFALSLLGRRALGAASHNFLTSVEFFLYGLHALFKGDFRITSVNDEWIFCDMELLRKVVAPGVRMSVKLHQDHFMSPNEYDDPSVLYGAISDHEKSLVISHEGDPAWRTAVLSGAPSLLALRHVVDDGADEYKIIMLNKRYISFRVIKLNKECVRGLWSGQQQELIFLRNRNPERGSIQNAKQALRNIINSSCDQPIGYPIYVSPLTTSFLDTNKQVTALTGGPLSISGMKGSLMSLWNTLWSRCRDGCSSGSSGAQTIDCEAPYLPPGSTQEEENVGDRTSRGGSLPNPTRNSLVSNQSNKPSSGNLTSLAVLLSKDSAASDFSVTPNLSQKSGSKEHHRSGGSVSSATNSNNSMIKKSSNSQELVARIVDPLMVYDNINLGRRIDPMWPDDNWKSRGGRNNWKDWLPQEGMEGSVVHKWSPCHREPLRRSHVDKTIVLLKIEDRYVPIVESAVVYVNSKDDKVPSSSCSKVQTENS